MQRVDRASFMVPSARFDEIGALCRHAPAVPLSRSGPEVAFADFGHERWAEQCGRYRRWWAVVGVCAQTGCRRVARSWMGMLCCSTVGLSPPGRVACVEAPDAREWRAGTRSWLCLRPPHHGRCRDGLGTRCQGTR
jgi:hypothetical protein